MGFPMHMIDLIKKLYENQETAVKAGLHNHIHVKFASHLLCDHRM